MANQDATIANSTFALTWCGNKTRNSSWGIPFLPSSIQSKKIAIVHLLCCNQPSSHLFLLPLVPMPNDAKVSGKVSRPRHKLSQGIVEAQRQSDS
jgi:hypothetical protein